MKKIVISLSIIAMSAGIILGATGAYFSDTETSTGNTITAGTIDIDIDGENPWEGTYTIDDLKPSQVDYINFTINNVGLNPVEVYKKISGMQGSGGAESYDCTQVDSNYNCSASSEPECVAEACTPSDDLESQIVYDLSVEVYDGQDELLWWQTFYTDEMGNSLDDVYGSGDSVDLGMIPVNGYMEVAQSYHLDYNAGNEYQGDELTFDIEITGEQLNKESGYSTVILEDKSGAPDWIIQDGNGLEATLSYKPKGSGFEFTLNGKVNTGGQDYTLIYPGPSGDYPCTGSLVLGSGTADGDGDINFSGNPNLDQDLVEAKAWLVPSDTYDDGSNLMTGWENADNLYETSLIDYEDTDS